MAAGWMSRRCFRWVHSRRLIYNTCWEDPRVDREALRLGPDDTVAMITSAGCNALDYALCGPKRIYAVDVNPRQNHLLELKLAGIRRLEFDDFFALFGCGASTRAEAWYRDVLRGDLSPPAQAYWDRHMRYFRATRPRGSFYFHGTTGAFAWAINLYIDHFRRLRDDVERLLAAPSLAEQQAIYDDRLRGRFWTPWLRWWLGCDATLSLLGVPRNQRLQLEATHAGGIVRFVEERLERVFARRPLADNYFWRVYLSGRYTRECCPEYLKRENFDRLRNGLADRIECRTTSLARFLREAPEPISRFVLLDHMDWLAEADPEGLDDEWQAIMDCAAPGARAIWRSGASRTDFVDLARVRIAGRERRVGQLLRYDRQGAEKLHALDRVQTYGSFHIADLSAA